MCGIAGVAYRERVPVDPGMLDRMTRVLAHRGPDGQGVHIEAGIGLGHRRLAIIDLATGGQPMVSSTGRSWITYNGEIYNFRELRAELEGRYRFHTASDTEVLLAAYEAWGTGFLSRLRGMFAFGLWDAERRRLLLARDRVGIKPLVYAWDGRRLLFGSEIKAILQAEGVRRDVDVAALRDYLTFLYVPSPATIFTHIRKLPPASYLVWEPDHGAPRIRRYWDLLFQPDESRGEGEWLDGLRWQLRDAVESHLVSDVPVGAFLSGGVDSSTVVATMADGAGSAVRTFSVGFDEAEFDELPYARQVARQVGTAHYEFIVKPEALGILPRLAWQFDEPFGDASALATYHVARITREHVKVALSGDGGDENFAGYRRYAQALALHKRLDRLPGLLARPLLRRLATLLPRGARGRGYAAMLGSGPIERYARIVSCQPLETVEHLLASELACQGAVAGGLTTLQRYASEASSPDYVSTLQYVDIRSYLPDDILTKVDRATMLVSLEARVPLLDHRLMEYVATIPSSLKLAGGEGKRVLKQTMADRLPPSCITRRKMGFGVPLAVWFRGELRSYARDLLLGARARQRGLLRPAAVERLLDEHQTAGRDRSALLWGLVCLEQWARRWLDTTGGTAP